jgi:hypothetical protein
MTDLTINKILLSLCGSQDIVDRWWQSPNVSLDSKTPAVMIEIDRVRVETYIFNKSDGGEY